MKTRILLIYKIVISFFVLTVSLCLSGPAIQESRAAEVVDRIVAVVNEDIILLSELNRHLKPVKKQIRTSGFAPEKEAEEIYNARVELINDLIDEKLADQMLSEEGIRVSEDEVNAAIERIKSNNRMTKEDLRDVLQENRISMEEYREDVRQQILRNKLINRKVKSKVVITEDDIEEYYEANPEKYGLKGKYSLKNIFMPYDEEDNHRIRRKMEYVLEELESGASFSEMAKKHSMAPNADDGGELGTFQLDDLSGHLQPVIAAMEPGQFTDIIETGIGFQIFSVKDIIDPEKQDIDDAKQKIEQKLYDEKVEEKFDEWIESLRKTAHIRILL